MKLYNFAHLLYSTGTCTLLELNDTKSYVNIYTSAEILGKTSRLCHFILSSHFVNLLDMLHE